MFIFFIQKKLDKYYIGYTENINDRIAKHNRSRQGFTSVGKPWDLVYIEQFDSKQAAMKREKQLKSWKNKVRIESLIGKSGAEKTEIDDFIFFRASTKIK